jgi:YhcH/YjgK/YiaL family protein
MVYDLIKNCVLYERNGRYKKAFNYLLDYAGQKPGRYELGDGVIASVQDRPTASIEERRFENHKIYVDIQYLIEGNESVAVTLNSDFEIDTPYNEETDVAFFKGQGRDVSVLSMKPGYFLVLYPHDYHKPLIGDGSTVKKIVMKVPLDI